jgi:hypothetical protein
MNDVAIDNGTRAGRRLPQSGSTVDCGAAIIDVAGRVKSYARLCHSIWA